MLNERRFTKYCFIVQDNRLKNFNTVNIFQVFINRLQNDYPKCFQREMEIIRGIITS